MPKEEPRSAAETRSARLLAVLHAYPKTALAERVKAEYCRITEAQDLPSDIPRESAVFQAEQTFGEHPDERAADELLRAFEQAVIREAYQEAVRNLRRAESTGDSAAIADAQRACATLAARLAAFEH